LEQLSKQSMTINTAEDAGAYPKPSLLRGDELRDRFMGLWRRCGGPAVDLNANDAWGILEARYEEPHRYYHDKRHLAHCLKEFDLALDRMRYPDQVEMAIWFHDVINQPGHPDNEARSAELFRGLAEPVMSARFVPAVVALILVTTHRESPSDPDHKILCDIDLASLGYPWESYLRDTGHLRAEFRGSDQDYCRSKRAFLEAMLGRPRIFLTDFFYDRYERHARENLRTFLDLIEEWEASGIGDEVRIPALRTSWIRT
jgi:predicted metal-dependent HD superfamily phosphohydrolase